MAAPYYMYLPLTEPEEQTRAICLYPSANIHAPLVGELLVIELKDQGAQAFEAISYAWEGQTSSNEYQLILVDDTGFQEGLNLTKNCSDVLRHMRSAESSRFLWIDFVCINQLDVREKSYQVGNMARIYAVSSSVTVWLGQDVTTNGLLAFQLLAACSDAQDVGVQASNKHNSPNVERLRFLSQTVEARKFHLCPLTFSLY